MPLYQVFEKLDTFTVTLTPIMLRFSAYLANISGE
jgi:hypothetical protein